MKDSTNHPSTAPNGAGAAVGSAQEPHTPSDPTVTEKQTSPSDASRVQGAPDPGQAHEHGGGKDTAPEAEPYENWVSLVTEAMTDGKGTASKNMVGTNVKGTKIIGKGEVIATDVITTKVVDPKAIATGVVTTEAIGNGGITQELATQDDAGKANTPSGSPMRCSASPVKTAGGARAALGRTGREDSSKKTSEDKLTAKMNKMDFKKGSGKKSWGLGGAINEPSADDIVYTREQSQSNFSRPLYMIPPHPMELPHPNF